jgi:hypothetical protein
MAAEVAEQGDGGRAHEQRRKMEKLSSIRSHAKISNGEQLSLELCLNSFVWTFETNTSQYP